MNFRKRISTGESPCYRAPLAKTPVGGSGRDAGKEERL